MNRNAGQRRIDNTAIRSFQVDVPEAELTELRRRVTDTRFPERETVGDHAQGVPLATLQKLASYWATQHDWRRVEAQLNALPQFVTEIDGLDIHFVHLSSRHENALPLLVTHGCPGSVIEQLKIVDPLINPTAYGASKADAFDVVIPSLPGHGFSGKPSSGGWEPARIARAWLALMKRLEYTRFVAQGGGFGGLVTEQLGVQAPAELLGIHTNMPATVPPDLERAAAAGAPPPPSLSAEERHAYEQLDLFHKRSAYARMMASRPQSLMSLSDSPVGLAAFLLDHDASSLELISRVFDGGSEGLTRDDVLDNITLVWLTNTPISAARLYWENKLALFDAKGVSVPTAVSIFPRGLCAAPRTWAERAYPQLIHYNELEKGGHFAAWEQPELFAQELRSAFRSLRRAV